MDSAVQHRRVVKSLNRMARDVAPLIHGDELVKRQRTGGALADTDDDDDDDDDDDIFESIFGNHNPTGTTTTSATAVTPAQTTTRAAVTTAAETTRPTATTAAATTSRVTSVQPTTTSAVVPTTTSRVTTSSVITTSSSSSSRVTTTSTSSTPTTSATTSKPPVTSHVTTTLADPTTSSRSTAFVTQSLSASFSASNANSAASASVSASGATSNAGGIAGGVIGGIVGVVALFFVASWFIRRRRRQADEIEWNKQFNDGFNPGNFRKSAIMLPPDNNNGSIFNPRPAPSMIERKMSPPAAAYSPYNNAPPASYNQSAHGRGYSGEQYGYGAENYGAAAGGYGQEDQYAQYQQYNQYSQYPAYNNASLSSANPFVDPHVTGYTPSVSPVPGAGNYNVMYNERGEPVLQQPLTRQPSNGTMLSQEMQRQPSVASASAIGLARSTSQITAVAPPSQRVMSPPMPHQPMPIAQPAHQSMPVAQPNELLVSPFADVSVDAKDARMSSVSNASIGQFPEPPSSVHPPVSRYQIDSMPPTLPDMQFNSHSSTLPGQDYPSSIHNSMSSFLGPVVGEPRPSPLANSAVPEPTTPPPVVPKDTVTAPGQAAPALAGTPAARVSADAAVKKERPPTVYDEADAYGGI